MATTNHKCELCGQPFKTGERYDDFGDTYNGIQVTNYYVHIECVKNELQKYSRIRHKWKTWIENQLKNNNQ